MTVELSLFDAFRALGPLVGQPEVDDIRNAAAGRVLHELQAIARRSRGARPDLEDAIQDTLRRLTQVGPRGVRATDPTTDEEVRNYLTRALHNNLITIERKQRAPLLAEPRAEQPDPRPGPDVTLDLAAQGRERDNARAQLEEIVRTIAARRSPSAANSFLRTISQLRDIVARRTTVNDVVQTECTAAPGFADWRTARNGVDKRFARARKQLYKEISELRDQGALTVQRYLALRQLIDELRLREKNEDL